jgi:hypothetical protein
MSDPLYRGHDIVERYVGEGITFYVVSEHDSGLVGGRGSFGTLEGARHDVDRCCERAAVADCDLRARALHLTSVDDLMDRQALRLELERMGVTQ